MNIAFITSQGGHSGQIKLIFTNEVIRNNNAIMITERPGVKNIVKKNAFNGKYPVYLFEKDILLKLNPINYFITLQRLMKIFRKEKIDLIITNGAQISIPAVIGAKLLGIKSLFIDTVIRVKTPNWSARACYPLADIFLVQHPGMIKKYGKKAKYYGGII